MDGGVALALAELPPEARTRTTRLSRHEFTQRPTPAVARLRRAGFRTLAPLTVSGRLLALFAVADRGGRVPLSAEDVELLETVLAPAALALDHARLFEELKSQADRYRSLQEFHENVVAGSAAAIAATDGEGRFTSVNPAFAALVGRGAASLRGCRASEVLPAALLVADPPARVEADLGSGTRVLNVAVSPFPGAPAGSAARVLVLVDATETARLERALADRERLSALGTLSAGVAHEVNTPLAGVAGFARLLLDETPGDDPRRPLVEKIERQAFRASRLVGSLLDLARGRPREIEPLDPSDVAREAVRALEDEGAARGARVRLEVPRPVPAVAGHRDALVQVLVNLVKNGIEAATAPSPARPGAPEVVLAVSASGGQVLLRRHGQRPGPLRRGRGPRLRALLLDEDGAGRNGARPLDGAGYHPGPRRHADRDVRCARRPFHRLVARRGLTDMATVLILDDEPVIRDVLGSVLAKAGHVTREAATAAEGLARLEKEPIDLLLLDLMLPDRPGLEVLVDVRSRHPEIPVVVVTAYSSVESAITAMREGAFHYIPKPFRNEEVVHVVRQALEKRRLVAENRALRAKLDASGRPPRARRALGVDGARLRDDPAGRRGALDDPRHG